MVEPLENLYFNWLCAKVAHVEVPTPSLTYWDLFRHLYTTEFVWLVHGDANRLADGLELRHEFLVEAHLGEERGWRETPCSVLETMIAFARHAEFTAGESVSFWFWRFVENLGLIEANDASDISVEEIETILDDFVWRKYDENGRGGLFPLEHTTKNQREVEIWYQFNEYLVDQDWPI